MGLVASRGRPRRARPTFRLPAPGGAGWLIVLLSTVALSGWSPRPMVSIGSLRIVPHSVQLISGSMGTLSLELLDEYEYAITPVESMHITWTSANTQRVTVEVIAPGIARLTAGQPGSDSVAIAVSAQKKVDTAWVRVLPVGPTPRSDLVSAPAAALSMWNRLMRRDASGVWQRDDLAFRSDARVTGLNGGGPLALFSLNHPVALVPQPGQYVAFVDAAPNGPNDVQLETARPVLVRIRSATDVPVDLEDLATAKRILAHEQTGIELIADGGVTSLAPASLAWEDCAHLATLFPGAYQATDAVIFVFYVSQLEGARGLACDPDPHGPARAILLGERSPTTLAHELGHILDFWEPHDGHVNSLPGYDQHNVMWSGASDVSEATRSAYSLAQVFRLTMDARAFVNATGAQAGPARPDCRAQDVADSASTQGDCPPLVTGKEQPPR